jgi:PST family polysaccharide transporter
MKVVIKSTVALTSAHAVGYAISLAEVPILARALGPQAYGELLWVQMTALLISMLVDYGFTLSASRQVARNRSNHAMLGTITGNVFLAKAGLLLAVMLPIALALSTIKLVSTDLALAGFVYVIAFGMSPLWYFQGTQKLGRFVVIEILTRTTALLGLLVLVKQPTDAALALWLMASGALLCTLVTSWMCLREVGSLHGSLGGAVKEIQSSTSIFVYKSSSSLVATAATSVLGGVSGAAAVGIFAPADKVTKAMIGLALPIFNAFYPYFSGLFAQDNSKTERQALLLSAAILVAGVVAALILSLVGPTLMQWLLGNGFEQAGELLALMVWLIPLRLGNQTLAFTMLLPAQLEHRASISTLLASTFALGLGAMLAIKHGAFGMVWAILLGETLLLLSQLYMSRHILGRGYRQ